LLHEKAPAENSAMRRAAFATKPEVRLAAFYALIFGAFGVSLPYWPLWLASRGLAPDEIGLVFALTSLAKIVATPLATALADRLDRRRAVIAWLVAASLAANLCFVPARGWAAILAISPSSSHRMKSPGRPSIAAPAPSATSVKPSEPNRRTRP